MIKPNTDEDKEHLKRWGEALDEAFKNCGSDPQAYEQAVSTIHLEFMSQYESSEQINALWRLYAQQGLAPERPDSDF